MSENNGNLLSSKSSSKEPTVTPLPILRTPYTLKNALTELKIPTLIEQYSLKLPMVKPCTEKLENDLKKSQKEDILFYKTDDHPFNKKHFKYKPCRPNPLLETLLFGTSDLPPFNASLCYFDRSQGMYVNEKLDTVLTEYGWRSARANVNITEGKWFFEFIILNASNEPSERVHSSPHVRVGISRREASLEAPVGHDAYGYGFRDVEGQVVHLSRRKPLVADGFKSGDVLGLLVELPSLERQMQIADEQIIHKTPGEPSDAESYYGRLNKQDNPVAKNNSNNNKQFKKRKTIKKLEDDERARIGGINCDNDIVRDQIPIRYKNEMYFEQYEYKSTGPFEHLLNPLTVFGETAVQDSIPFKPAKLPDSKIVLYKNGELVGTVFEEELYAFLPPSSKLYIDEHSLAMVEKKQYNNDGSLGYYPTISVFKNGCAKLNVGPRFTCLPELIESQLQSGNVRSLHERYLEKIAEDTVYDIIDEVECATVKTKF